ncbi:MAG: hypothetical protein AUJ19_04550 [Parcubacteria group bacterium CG1_02_58_44]|nr:MAG: hypothetical protein AUJ19_04550 [Parcubacteria group bacterium CG1_02_58_44]
MAGGTQAAELPLIHLFWASGCPHCAAEKVFLADLSEKYPGLVVRDYEISTDRTNADLFRWVGQSLGTEFSGVPVTVVGSHYVFGFRDAETSGRAIEDMIELVRSSGEEDIVTGIVPSMPDTSVVEIAEPAVEVITSSDVQDVKTVENSLDDLQPDDSIESEQEPADPPLVTENEVTADRMLQGLPEEVHFPVVGTISLKNISLPLLTIVLALLDGFNPCAMWVLLFLLSLLVGMPDRRRAWILGVSFIAASSLVYFLFLTAWLHVFLFLGFVFWIRLAVGVVAVVAGAYYLYDFTVSKRGGCHVVSDGLRDRIFCRARAAVSQSSLLLGVVGIVALAFAVNLVELVCSAGLPAVYTHILAGSHLASWQHYSYLAFYILIFMIDDIFVFLVAMVFLQLTGIQHKYTRYTRLVGGILMLAIGLLLFFRPEWLTFG